MRAISLFNLLPGWRTVTVKNMFSISNQNPENGHTTQLPIVKARMTTVYKYLTPIP
jgi:hypothetical protein